jgi:ABC-2 type transport system permease protein
MKKYWHVIAIGIQNNLTYRFNYLTRTLFSFIPLFAMLSLWRTIYAGKAQGSALGGYTQAGMIFYYMLVAVVDVLTNVNEDDWQIATDIREGNISQFLLKPIDYLWYRLCLFFSGRIAFISMASVPLAVFIFCFRGYVVMPASGMALVAFAISLVFTALLQFFISYSMAMLAFWMLEISTFIFILFAFEYIASGHLFPLDLLPPALRDVLYCTPSAFTWGKLPAQESGSACSCNCSGCCWAISSRDSPGHAASGNTRRLADEEKQKPEAGGRRSEVVKSWY